MWSGREGSAGENTRGGAVSPVRPTRGGWRIGRGEEGWRGDAEAAAGTASARRGGGGDVHVGRGGMGDWSAQYGSGHSTDRGMSFWYEQYFAIKVPVYEIAYAPLQSKSILSSYITRSQIASSYLPLMNSTCPPPREAIPRPRQRPYPSQSPLSSIRIMKGLSHEHTATPTSSRDLGFSSPSATCWVGTCGPLALYALGEADWRPPCVAGSEARSEGLLVLAGWGRMLNSNAARWWKGSVRGVR